MFLLCYSVFMLNNYVRGEVCRPKRLWTAAAAGGLWGVQNLGPLSRSAEADPNLTPCLGDWSSVRRSEKHCLWPTKGISMWKYSLSWASRCATKWFSLFYCHDGLESKAEHITKENSLLYDLIYLVVYLSCERIYHIVFGSSAMTNHVFKKSLDKPRMGAGQVPQRPEKVWTFFPLVCTGSPTAYS